MALEPPPPGSRLEYVDGVEQVVIAYPRSRVVIVFLCVWLLLWLQSSAAGIWALATYGFMQGNTMAGALSVDPRRAGSISALMGAMSFAVGAVASWAAGAFHDGTPRPMAAVMLAALLGSAASLRFLALPKKA